ncbi:MAG: DUF4242 domain-containing protein [Acidimicrobiales bacterium]|nr:DUF4242 domain-containing protein [Acidimicrobiales bacterium]
MPRYLVERTFPDGLEVPIDNNGAQAVRGIVDNNSSEDVTWITSYVTDDHGKTFCVYDGPNPESIRRAAEKSSVPVDAISEVRVLDPYFYMGATT